VLGETGLAPTHPLALLTAFRMDVTKRRYASWDELIHYCRYSAMPVGRFVLDVHGEDESTWAHSDPLCSALQVINHLQDCAKDYCDLDRVYLPLDILEAHHTNVAALLDPRASPALIAGLHEIARKTAALMPEASKLPLAVRDARLGLETGAIVSLAHKLIAILMVRDPLSERVHLTKPGMAWHGLWGALDAGTSRLIGPGTDLRLRLR
jgi:phytoene/squalene synthetase